MFFADNFRLEFPSTKQITLYDIPSGSVIDSMVVIDEMLTGKKIHSVHTFTSAKGLFEVDVKKHNTKRFSIENPKIDVNKAIAEVQSIDAYVQRTFKEITDFATRMDALADMMKARAAEMRAMMCPPSNTHAYNSDSPHQSIIKSLVDGENLTFMAMFPRDNLTNDIVPNGAMLDTLVYIADAIIDNNQCEMAKTMVVAENTAPMMDVE